MRTTARRSGSSPSCLHSNRGRRGTAGGAAAPVRRGARAVGGAIRARGRRRRKVARSHHHRSAAVADGGPVPSCGHAARASRRQRPDLRLAADRAARSRRRRRRRASAARSRSRPYRPRRPSTVSSGVTASGVGSGGPAAEAQAPAPASFDQVVADFHTAVVTASTATELTNTTAKSSWLTSQWKRAGTLVQAASSLSSSSSSQQPVAQTGVFFSGEMRDGRLSASMWLGGSTEEEKRVRRIDQYLKAHGFETYGLRTGPAGGASDRRDRRPRAVRRRADLPVGGVRRGTAQGGHARRRAVRGGAHLAQAAADAAYPARPKLRRASRVAARARVCARAGRPRQLRRSRAL